MVAREVLIEKLTLESKAEGDKEAAKQTSEGRDFQAKGKATAKIQRKNCAV